RAPVRLVAGRSPAGPGRRERGTGRRIARAIAFVTADRLLTVEEARERVFAAIAGPTESEVAWLSEGLGRVAAEHITSPIALPPWDNSAMDGYAIRAADTAAARGAPG